jgi:hypothetical protein
MTRRGEAKSERVGNALLAMAVFEGFVVAEMNPNADEGARGTVVADCSVSEHRETRNWPPIRQVFDVEGLIKSTRVVVRTCRDFEVVGQIKTNLNLAEPAVAQIAALIASAHINVDGPAIEFTRDAIMLQRLAAELLVDDDRTECAGLGVADEQIGADAPISGIGRFAAKGGGLEPDEGRHREHNIALQELPASSVQGAPRRRDISIRIAYRLCVGVIGEYAGCQDRGEGRARFDKADKGQV